MRIIKIIVVIIIGLSITLGIMYYVRYGRSSERRSALAMGTMCEIIVVEPSRPKRTHAFKAAFRLINKVENAMSVYRPESDVHAINTADADTPVTVSSDVYFVIEQSLTFARLTNGAFDITIVPLARLWGFYDKQQQIPTAEDIAQALRSVGYQHIQTAKGEDGRYRISRDTPDVAIDLGGVAKGYACDLAATAVHRTGVKAALINIGGTMYALGRPQPKKPWRIGIRHPEREHESITSVALHNQAIATSGSYEQFFVHNGQRYSHIIDPRTGYPVANNVLAVSVIAPSATVADIFSTALVVMGFPDGFVFAENLNGIEAYFIVREEDAIKTVATENFFSSSSSSP